MRGAVHAVPYMRCWPLGAPARSSFPRPPAFPLRRPRPPPGPAPSRPFPAPRRAPLTVFGIIEERGRSDLGREGTCGQQPASQSARQGGAWRGVHGGARRRIHSGQPAARTFPPPHTHIHTHKIPVGILTFQLMRGQFSGLEHPNHHSSMASVCCHSAGSQHDGPQHSHRFHRRLISWAHQAAICPPAATTTSTTAVSVRHLRPVPYLPGRG
jgi:hypothetical protein